MKVLFTQFKVSYIDICFSLFLAPHMHFNDRPSFCKLAELLLLERLC